VVVLDASVLIALAKIERLHLVRAVYEAGMLSPAVFAEVVDAGRRIRAPGMEWIEHALSEGWLQTARLTSAEVALAARLRRSSRLHGGEAEALAIASRRKLAIVVDDKPARHAAAALGLDFLGTAGVLLEARFTGRLTLAEFEKSVVALADVIWLAPRVVAAVFSAAREGKR
jgi:predicted nucleic acid-binding protein